MIFIGSPLDYRTPLLASIVSLILTVGQIRAYVSLVFDYPYRSGPAVCDHIDVLPVGLDTYMFPA